MPKKYLSYSSVLEIWDTMMPKKYLSYSSVLDIWDTMMPTEITVTFICSRHLGYNDADRNTCHIHLFLTAGIQ